MTRDLPAGTVTFLFTDVEGSTRLLHALGAEAYADALAAHRSALRDAFARHGGVEVDTQGDAFFVAFPTAPAALAAALEGRDALSEGPIRVRMGLHTGTPHLGAEGYIGPDVHKGARIAAAGHGGQILVSAATAALLDADLRDLGNHRLKDLDAPERLFQADPDQHPPLKSLHRANLPAPTTAFIGRSSELKGAVGRLSGGTRLLTLTGPGGSGKTRLAIEAARELVGDAPDGVFWIGLAELTDAELALAEVARTIGAPDDLPEHIGDRRLVLVLDNLEQVLDIGPRLAVLLEACPNLRILATSRERLRVRGEEEFQVPPLPGTDAERLFEERAGVGGPEVAELCRRLDNLPLAVELAAARARVLSPQQILARLEKRLDLFRGGRDADARQQTLRGAIEWSHDLLDAGERELFARLGVFRGGWNFEAAEAVADAEIDTLASLVDKSLVTRTEERFGMLETLRVFAEERLAALPDEAAVRARHLDHFIGLAETWYDARFASEPTLLRLVDADTDNVRAAFEWALEHRPDDAVRLAGAVAPLWSLGGRTSEAKARLSRAMERSPGVDRSHVRALTELAEFDDDVEGLQDAVGLWRRLGDADGEADALESLGWAFDAIGDYAAAQSAYEQSLAIRERIGSPELHGLSSRAGLCHVFVARARTTEAAATASELLALARSQDAVLMEELALHFLADCSLVDGDFAEAEIRYRAALACAHDAGLVRRETDEVIGVAMALAGSGEHARAVRLAAAAHAKQAEIAQGTDAWWRRMQDELLGPARGALSDDERMAAERQGTATGFDRIVAELLAGA
ncbi:MAG TPA: adenylate/guanylate cyclase domain-containing protein [Candidatus Limnocylindria bacterium]|nr:adenylate/guanylate cyclase domain-containing protein [Candidatus Limnocylindria bacterium]